jgi:hypothetical protein
MAADFWVEAIETTETVETITLIFENQAGERRPVTLLRSRIPLLLSFLQSRIEVGSVTPTRPGSPFADQRFALQGYHVSRNADQSAQIIFYVRLPDEGDRGLTVPLDLTPQEARELAKALCP